MQQHSVTFNCAVESINVVHKRHVEEVVHNESHVDLVNMKFAFYKMEYFDQIIGTYLKTEALAHV